MNAADKNAAGKEAGGESAMTTAMRIFQERCVAVSPDPGAPPRMDAITIYYLLQACLLSGDAESALAVRSQAADLGVPLSFQSEQLLLRGLVTLGRPGQAFRVYEEAKREHNRTPPFKVLEALTEACHAAAEIAADDEEKAVWMERALALFGDGQALIERRQVLRGHPTEERNARPPPRAPRPAAPYSWETGLSREERTQREASMLAHLHSRKAGTRRGGGTAGQGEAWNDGPWQGDSWQGDSWQGEGWRGEGWQGDSWQGDSWQGEGWQGGGRQGGGRQGGGRQGGGRQGGGRQGGEWEGEAKRDETRPEPAYGGDTWGGNQNGWSPKPGSRRRSPPRTRRGAGPERGWD